MPALSAIPTNVITGFLGVGKTTAILNLLKQKPTEERWAVLVNEFGEVGIDGSLCGGQESEPSGVFIREVPGGCMCCAAGLPMQIALNMLLARAKPHRLLIEPTGLGHPKEVLGVLSAEHYKEVLELQATITLVDARKISDERYTGNTTFNQQLEVADIIVANKADQYQASEFTELISYLDSANTLASKPVYKVSNGQLALEWLQAPCTHTDFTSHQHSFADQSIPPLTQTIPDIGYLTMNGQGEGFFSSGWVFSPGWVFDEHKLYYLLMGIDAERIKGVFNTENGAVAFNKADNVLTQSPLPECADSRIEMVSRELCSESKLTEELLNCVTSK